MNKLSVNTWSFLMKVKREKKIIMKIKLQIKFLLNLVEKENHLEKKRGEREREDGSYQKMKCFLLLF